MEYFVFMNPIYAGEYYTSPAIAAEELAKLKHWEPQCPLARIHFRLLDAKTKQVPSVFDPRKFYGRMFLMVSHASDTPANEMERIDVVADGTATYHTKSVSRFVGCGKIYFHAVYREVPRKDKQGWELVPFFKPVTTFHQFDPKKKVHNVDVLVESVGPDAALVAETTLAVTDKASGKAIERAAVYALASPHRRFKVGEPLPLKAGKYKLLFYAEGYRLLKQEVTVHAKGKHTETVTLEPLPEPVKITFDGPADTPAEQIILQYRYDAYPFLGVLQARSLKPDKGRPSLGLSLTGGKGEALCGIDAAQAFTLCASALPSPKFVANEDSVSMPLPLMLYRHDAKTPAPARIALSVPKHVEWRGKIDMNALGAKKVLVIWARKVEGMSDMPLAAGTHSQNGACAALLEPGASYERYALVYGKDDGAPSDYRSLPPYTVPADAKELPEETLTPGPQGSGKAVHAKIGGWTY